MAVFSFNDIVGVDSTSIEKVLREANCGTFVKALQSADVEVRGKILAKLPDRISARLKTQVENSSFPSRERVKAQGEIIAGIERACKDQNYHLDLRWQPGDRIRDAFAACQDRRSDLAQIRSLSIFGELLPVIAQFLEMDKIEKLCVCNLRPEYWPHLKKISCLKSLEISWASSIPENIGDLQSLTKLLINCPYKCLALPESIGNLKNLTSLKICSAWNIERLPDSIGDLQSLTELSLNQFEMLKNLPDSIGNLRNLTHLDISGSSSIKHLPDSIELLESLKYVNLRGTGISSVPPSIFRVENFIDSKRLWVIPQGKSLSYRDFVNVYYTLAAMLIRFYIKGRREGLLAIMNDFEGLFEKKDFLHTGLCLMVNGTDATIIRQILTSKMEREHDFYRKKLMGIAIEGILAIQECDDTNLIYTKLSSTVHIKDNPIEAAWKKYISGDETAFDNIDFKSAMLPEGEREEVIFIKRVIFLSELVRKEGILAIEKHLDKDAIAARDPLEYGLSLVADIWLMGLDYRKVIGDIISKLIDLAPDPVQRNIAMAKKEAVMLILANYNIHVIKMSLLAYFDEDIAKAFPGED